MWMLHLGYDFYVNNITFEQIFVGIPQKIPTKML